MSDIFKRIGKFYKLLEKRDLFFIILGGFLAVSPILFNFFTPIIIKDIIDGLTKSVIKFDKVYVLGALYAVSLLFSFIGENIFQRAKYKAAFGLINKIFEYSFYFPWQKLKKQGSAYYATLIGSQLNDAFVVLDYYLLTLIFHFARLVMTLALVFTWSKIFFGLFLFNFLLSIYSFIIVNKVSQKPFQEGFELSRRAMSFLTESFDNIQDVICGEYKDKKIQECKSLSDNMTKVYLKGIIPAKQLQIGLVDLPEYVSRLLILAYGGYLVTKGQMSVGTILALWTYFGYLAQPLQAMKSFGEVISRSGAALYAVLKFFDEAKESKDKYDKKEIEVVDREKIYELRNVSYKVNNNGKLFDELSLEIKKGEIVSIVGLSGEGKSTLLNLLLGFVKNYEGEVRFLGNEIKGVYPLALFKYIGYYSQNVGIFNAPLEENIVLGREYDKEKLERIISELGIQHLSGRNLGEGGSFISGGEKQRVQLARLFYADKPIVILDEPLTNVDMLTEKFLIEKLVNFLRNRTCIIISHKPNIIKLGERIVFLENGKISASGSFNEMMESHETFKKIIETYSETVANTTNAQ